VNQSTSVLSPTFENDVGVRVSSQAHSAGHPGEPHEATKLRKGGRDRLKASQVAELT